jgi:hypothetical protein
MDHALALVHGHREMPGQGLLASVATYWKALRDASAALREYEELTRSGIPHEKAVERVFEDHFGR